jgi:hypothetical protein
MQRDYIRLSRVFSQDGLDMSGKRSIKGIVKRKTSTATGEANLFAMLSSPCPVERLWRFSVFADSFVIVTTLSTSDANKPCGCKCQPWFYLRLVAYSFFWLSEGAYGLSRDWQCSKHTLRLNALMDTHPRTRAPEEPTTAIHRTGYTSCSARSPAVPAARPREPSQRRCSRTL